MKNLTTILMLGLFLCACYDYDKHYESIDASLNPVVEISRVDGALANGVDSLTIRVLFPPQAGRDSIRVNFATTRGVFYENNKAEFSSSDFRRDRGQPYIAANLRATTSLEVLYLTVEVPGIYKRVTPVRLRPSYANSITTSKNKFAVKRSPSDEIQLLATLKAAQGLPHEGTQVEFVVADTLLSSDSRHFRSLTRTDANGQASVFFTPGAFKGYTGPVSYRAVTRINEAGDTVTATGTFEVIDPE